MKARKMTPLGLSNEQRNMVAVLLCGAVLVVLNQTLLSPALPSIMQHLQVDATTVQWLTSAYALVEAVVIPLAAWFMGRFSTRVLFMGGMALFGAGSLVAALAPFFRHSLGWPHYAGNGDGRHDGNGNVAYPSYVSS